MKLVSLNTWKGIVRQPLLDFIQSKKDEVDIFCFQEVLNGGSAEGTKLWKDADLPKEHQLLSLFQQLLPDHISFFYPTISTWDGLALFIRKNIPLIEEGEFFVHGQQPAPVGDIKNFNPRNIQFTKILIGKKPITIINFHGLWAAEGKQDTLDRIQQSKKILEFCKGLDQDFVLCGDFNLAPDTESLRMLEEFGLRNLIRETGITSTRTSFYKKEMRFADYVLVSKNIRVKDFKVLPDEVSDHCAMYLEFE